MKKSAVIVSICMFMWNPNLQCMCSKSDNLKKISDTQNKIKHVSFPNGWTNTHADLYRKICLARSEFDYEEVKEVIEKEYEEVFQNLVSCPARSDGHDDVIMQ